MPDLTAPFKQMKVCKLITDRCDVNFNYLNRRWFMTGGREKAVFDSVFSERLSCSG